MAYDSAAPDDRSSVRGRLRHAFLTGVALTIPLVLTLVVLQLALDLVSRAVSPFVAGAELLVGEGEVHPMVLEAVTVATLVVLVLLIGLVAEAHSGQSRLSEGFDALMSRIPGLGSVYTGTRHMSEVLIAGDTQSFQEVKLVEFPREGTFMVGFLTAEPPESIREVAGESSMQTLFVPLAPNPVMGGFLLHLAEERVHDVDLTVEEGVQSIVTSGAALDPRVDDVDAVGAGELVDVHPFDGGMLDWDGLDVGIPIGDHGGSEDDEEDEAGGSG